MSNKMFFLGLVAAVGACGGDDAIMNPIDAVPTIDASQIDGPSVGCTMAATYAADRFPNGLSLGCPMPMGNCTGPVAFPGRETLDMMGNPSGNYAIAIYGELTMLEPELGNHGFGMYMIEGAGMFTPGFESAALDTAITVNAGMTCGGCLEAEGGMPNPGVPTMTNPPTQIFVADTMMGSMTFTEITNTPPVAGQMSDVFGSYDNVTLNGFDPTTGMPLNPPCSTTVTKINFFFRPTWTAAMAAPGPKDWRDNAIRVPFHDGLGNYVFE
jgi:hypothetical protein